MLLAFTGSAFAQRQGPKSKAKPTESAPVQKPAAEAPSGATRAPGKGKGTKKLDNPAAASRKDTLLIPRNVLETFYAKFKNVKNAQWSHPAEELYAVAFTAADKNLTAQFAADGRWQQTAIPVAIPELPREIITVFAQKLKVYKMKSAQKAETYGRGTLYLVVAQKDGKLKEIGFNPEGRIMTSRDLP